MSKIFVDCGTHLGEGLKKHIEKYSIDETWQIYTFEANPHTFELLKKARSVEPPEQYKWLKWNNIQYFNKAVWIQDGEIEFYCSEVKDRERLKQSPDYNQFIAFHDDLVKKGDLLTPHQRDDFPIDGSSTLFPERLKGSLSRGDSLQKSLVWDKNVLVESFDFSTWLKNTVSEEDEVVCKVDIEGAEFEVLKKCIKDDTLKLIDTLNVEFHHFQNQDLVQDYIKIREEAFKLGINFQFW